MHCQVYAFNGLNILLFQNIAFLLLLLLKRINKYVNSLMFCIENPKHEELTFLN